MDIKTAISIMHPNLVLTGIREDDLKILESLYEHIQKECDRLEIPFEYVSQEGSKGYFCYEFKVAEKLGAIAFHDEGESITSIILDAYFLVDERPTEASITKALELIRPIESKQSVADHYAELFGDDYGF